MIIDSHAHIDDEPLLSRREEIVGGLKENGISAVIDVGYDLKSSLAAVETAEKYPNVFAAVGVHPSEAEKTPLSAYSSLETLFSDKKVVAVGEIGLDYHYDDSPPKEIQKEVFIRQLRLAYEHKLPTVIHLRDAYGDMLEILARNAKFTEYGILLHCYGGSKETAKILAEKYNAYFSFGGAITFKNATERPEIIRSIGIDRILVETDCPYMAPVPYRGKINEPKYINSVVDKLAEILEKDRDFIVKVTEKNTREFFKKINDSL